MTRRKPNSSSLSYTEADPYIIGTNADLQGLRDRVNSGTEEADKYYRLTQNLNISQITDWEHIGTIENPFKGHFDGNNLSVHINITSNHTTIKIGTRNSAMEDSYYSALFGIISTSDGYAVKDLTVSGTINSGNIYRAGGIAVILNFGSIENCTFTGTINGRSGNAYAGGIVAQMTNGNIRNCSVNGTIEALFNNWSGTEYAGGIAASITGGNIENCTVNGSTVNAQIYNPFSDYRNNTFAGGIVGYASIANFETVKDCTFSGNVISSGYPNNASNEYAGGIVGYISGGNVENNNVTANANSSSSISSIQYAGGIAGRIGDSTVIENCTVAQRTIVTATTEANYTTAEAAGGIIGLMESSTLQDNTSYATISEDTANLGGVVGKLDSASYTIQNNRYSNAEYGIGSNAQGVPGDEGCIKIGASLTITTTTLNAADAGTFYSTTLRTDSNGSVSWSLASGSSLPDGLTLNASTGVISGTPTTAGTYTFTVQANSGSAPATKELTLAVNLVITTDATLPNATAGTAYSQNLSARGANNITWSFARGSTLPSGLSLNNGRISGTPSTSGTSRFTIVASAGNNITASKVFSLTVNSSGSTPTPTPSLGTISITTTSIPSGVAGNYYTASLASNPSGASWSLNGSLPSNLSLSTSGTISGYPTVSGTFNFAVSAVSGTASANKSLSITIAPLQITTQSLSGGSVGNTYSSTLTSNGTNLTWSVSSGNLPSGLNLNSQSGLISGTLNRAGNYNFTITASNSYARASKSFSVNVTSSGQSNTTLKSSSESSSGGCNSGLGIFAALISGAMLIFKRSK